MDADPTTAASGSDRRRASGGEAAPLPATITSPPASQPNSTSHPGYGTHHNAGPATPLSMDNPRKTRDGYWKMKEAGGNASASTAASAPATGPRSELRKNGTPLTVAADPASSNLDRPSTSPSTNFQPLDPSTPGSSTNKLSRRRKPSPPPLLTTKGISLVFRMPPGTATSSNAPTTPANVDDGAPAPVTHADIDNGASAVSPSEFGDASGTDSGSKKKRRTEAPLRPTRARRSSPRRTSLTGSPAPNGNSATPANGALSIFAPPPPSDVLPQALQSALGSSAAPTPGPSTTAASGSGLRLNVDSDLAPAVDADSIRREAAAGFESRLRSRGQRRDGGERTGVSASGKDVRVGGTARTAQKLETNAAATAVTTGQTTATSKKKGKGKAEVEVPNQDFCSACRGIGRFLCCDGCPRSFHFMCLEPPLRIDELPDEETWYCKQCRADKLKQNRDSGSPTKEKELKPIPTVFKQLSQRVDAENPASFKLPQDIRAYFNGVATAPRGEYVDAEELRTKYDRKGFQEERDPFRTRDKQRHIECYACGGSSQPLHSLVTDPESAWRYIVSCDYCTLSWHLDCLDPPLSIMPSSAKKWMCPNHAEQAIPRRRTVRHNLETVDIESRHQPNNGNITVIPEPEPPKGPPLDYEDLVINRKKYRVPEKIIRLDFWEKVQKGGILKSTFTRDASESRDPPTQEETEAANLVLSLLQPRTDIVRQERVQPDDATQVENEARPSSPMIVDPHNANEETNGANNDSLHGQRNQINVRSHPNSPPNLPQTQAQALDQVEYHPPAKPRIVLRMPGGPGALAGAWTNGD